MSIVQILGAVTGIAGALVAILAYLRTGQDWRRKQFQQTLREMLATDNDIASALRDRIITLVAGDKSFASALEKLLEKQFPQTLRQSLATDNDVGLVLRDRIITLVASDKIFASALEKLLVREGLPAIQATLRFLQEDVVTVSRPLPPSHSKAPTPDLLPPMADQPPK